MATGYRLEVVDGLAEIHLASAKANAMGPATLAALDAALAEAEAGPARGVVLTGYDRFFSAGLDLVALYDLDRPALDAFMREFDRVMLRAFTFPRPLVAAVSGHAVAGGCVLALAADAQVLAAQGRMAERIGVRQQRVAFRQMCTQQRRHVTERHVGGRVAADVATGEWKLELHLAQPVLQRDPAQRPAVG